MNDTYIGIQKVRIIEHDKDHHIMIDLNESNNATRLFISDKEFGEFVRVNMVFSNPAEAYEHAVSMLELKGKTVDLEIEVAINVASIDDVAAAFSSAGVKVQKISQS